jgi:hypothetical protein
MGKLSATAVKAATRPGRMGDGDGLFLIVQPGGTKSWVCRVQKNGNRRDFGLGSASEVSLALARERTRAIRTWVEMDHDPIFERCKVEDIPTFKEAAAKVLAAHRKTCATKSMRGNGCERSRSMSFRNSGTCGSARSPGR